ncbi:MAG: hypothetical protein AAF821_19285 [Cyanobacteria bacterium P01_D01_bin.156]
MSDLQNNMAYQEMARLVNFDQPDATITPPNNSDTSLHHPEDTPSPRRFSQKGSTKILFVTGGVSTVALLVGLITNQIFRPVSVTSTETTETSYEADDGLTLSLEPPSENKGELGALRTEVALKDQAQELEDMDGDLPSQANSDDAIDSVETASSETTSVATSATTTTAPQPAASRSATAPRTAPVQTTPAPIQPRVVPTPMEPVNPWETWQQLAQSGTLGQLMSQSSSTARPRSSTVRPTVTRQSGTTTIGPARTLSSETSSQQQADTSLGTYINGHAPVPGMRHATTRTLAIGTTATATVTTPILWPGDGTQTTHSRAPDTPKYIVTLDEALTTADNHIVFPRSAQLIVTVAPMDTASGVATLDVLAVLRDAQAYTIPPGQLHIRGKAGNPLVAKRFNDPGGAIFSMDAGLFAISGLANLGTILNRPRSSTVVNSDFQGTIANDYDDPNFIGAVLEGGAGALADRLAERNDQAIEALAEHPSTWYLPAGTEVQLFVNQPMQI